MPSVTSSVVGTMCEALGVGRDGELEEAQLVERVIAGRTRRAPRNGDLLRVPPDGIMVVKEAPGT